MSKRRLGKGIDALLGGAEDDEEIRASVTEVDLDQIDSDPDQPRKHFSEEALRELAESIQSRGVIQPIILEDFGTDRYRIVAGERRYRAARLAGLTSVPAIIREFSADEKYEIALIENIQREDLNAIEEARGYQTIIDRYGFTQDEIAHHLGKKRSTIANSLRLLKLPEEVQNGIVYGAISAGHARAVLSVNNEQHQKELFGFIVDEGISVREAERAAATLNQDGSLSGAFTRQHPGEVPSAGHSPTGTTRGAAQRSSGESAQRKTTELESVENQLIERLGTKVVINGSENRGKIEISYFSLEDLNRLLDLLSETGDSA